jgi:CubicO group peptidase (beta-lactamase class C family)
MADRSVRCPTAVRGWRRRLVLLVVPILLVAATPAHRPAQAASAAPVAQVPPVQSAQAAQIIALVRETMETYSLRAAIVRVTIDGHELVTAALGESMTGVPATADMHFRNGAVAISYVATLLLTLVDDGVLGLDDPLSIWMPELPDADRVTLKMLANMTAGYPDYVPDEQFTRDAYLDPFRQWTPQELIAIGLAQPRLFAPGTNWDYAHTNYVILGLALERATGSSMVDLLQERVLGPLGLTNTANAFTPAIPEPALHAFSSERRVALGIAPDTPFYEESTYWSPSWTITHGAIQTTNIYDMAASAVAFGEGALLSPASHQAMVGPHLPPARQRVQLRARHRPQRRLAAAEPSLLRGGRRRGVPPRQEDRNRAGGHLRRGGVRRAGQLRKPRRHPLPRDRCPSCAGRCAPRGALSDGSWIAMPTRRLQCAAGRGRSSWPGASRADRPATRRSDHGAPSIAIERAVRADPAGCGENGALSISGRIALPHVWRAPASRSRAVTRWGTGDARQPVLFV